MSENGITFTVSKCRLARGKLTPDETSAVSERCNAAIARAPHARSSDMLTLSIVDEKPE